MNWTSEKRKLSDLVPWEHNPRQLKEKQAEHLKESLTKFGIVYPLLISPDNQIYDGHQRQIVLGIIEEYGEDAEVDVRVSERQLSDEERRELIIRLHENTGEWVFDDLANLYSFEELEDWGFNENLLDYFKGGDDTNGGGGSADELCRCPECGFEHKKTTNSEDD